MTKTLLFDIESIGVHALKADLGRICCYGFKWLGEKRAHCLTLTKEELDAFDDKRLLQDASEIMQEADILVGHFASVFDRRFFQGRLLIQNLPPIPPTKMRDTCMIARSVANFSSNRLKHLATILKLENRKLENNWPEAWFQVMRGNMKALKGMAKYCKGDVECLEELYLRLRPFDNAHTRMVEDRTKCGVCGGEVEYRGFAFLQDKRYRRFRCLECGRWGRETTCVK